MWSPLFRKVLTPRSYSVSTYLRLRVYLLLSSNVFYFIFPCFYQDYSLPLDSKYFYTSTKNTTRNWLGTQMPHAHFSHNKVLLPHHNHFVVVHKPLDVNPLPNLVSQCLPPSSPARTWPTTLTLLVPKTVLSGIHGRILKDITVNPTLLNDFRHLQRESHMFTRKCV